MVIIGSARIDENGNIKGGKAGDQTGKEVSIQEFYMHSKGWVGFKAKDSALAEKLARGMQIACDNPNLGYDQNERLGVVRNGIETKVKTECDCSSLVRAVLKYAGVEVCNFTTVTEKAVIMATGLFDEVEINSAADVTNGMILCTKTKGHTVIVISGEENNMFGIDVSRHQGNIDWSKVKKDFAIIKITNKGNVVEDKFEQNYKGCIDNNIPVGGYKYVYATTVNEARAEAEGMLKVLNGRKLPYGIWIDMEDKTIRPIGKQALSAVIITEAEILKAAGYDVGIYCNLDWYKNVLDSKTLEKSFPFWIARYPKLDNGSYNENSTLSPKSFAVAWQYSSKGKVDGIVGNVDMDVLFVPIKEVFGEQAAEPSYVGNPYPEPTKTLNKGAKGDSVRWVQYELKKRGYDLGRCGIDGDYGSASVKAVKSFQKSKGLVVDGITGKNTIKALKQG